MADTSGRWCWARSLGDCGGGISGEHLFSECVLAEETTLSGLPGRPPISLKRSAVVANILCRDHNAALSPLDSAAGRMVADLERVRSMMEARTRIALRTPPRNGRYPKRWSVHTTRVDRRLFERWLVKTSINVAVATKSELREDQVSREPGRKLVEFVFNRGPAPDDLVIALAAPLGKRGYIDRDYSVAFISAERVRVPGEWFVAAAVVGVASIHFLVSFIGTDVPKGAIAEAMAADNLDLVHLGGLNFDVGGRRSNELVFVPKAPRFAKPFP